MSKECPVCISPHRVEIEQRLKAKESYRGIARWLKAEHAQTIPHTTIYNHSQTHMALAEKFADKLLSIPKIRLALAPVPQGERLPSDISLPPLEALAHIQNIALDVVDALADQMNEAGLSSQQVSLFTGTLKEARQAAKHRHELVHGKKYIVEEKDRRHPDLKVRSTEELLRRREELRRLREERDRVH